MRHLATRATRSYHPPKSSRRWSTARHVRNSAKAEERARVKERAREAKTAARLKLEQERAVLREQKIAAKAEARRTREEKRTRRTESKDRKHSSTPPSAIIAVGSTSVRECDGNTDGVEGEDDSTQLTTLVPRRAMDARNGVIAPYLGIDNPSVAQLRARLRLCATGLSEHTALRRGRTEVATCRACGRAKESVVHVLLECVVFVGARTAAAGALRAVALDLDLAALAGIAPADRLSLVLAETEQLLLVCQELLLPLVGRTPRWKDSTPAVPR
jgi:hypothetical protein